MQIILYTTIFCYIDVPCMVLRSSQGHRVTCGNVMEYARHRPHQLNWEQKLIYDIVVQSLLHDHIFSSVINHTDNNENGP